MNKIKIMHLINADEVYGSEKVLLILVTEIDKNRFSSSVCCLEKRKSTSSEFRDKARSLGVGVFSIQVNPSRNPLVIFKLNRIMQQEKIDILHTHGFHADSIGALISLICNVKTISTNHLWFAESFKHKFWFYFGKKLLKRYNRIIAVSGKIKLQLLSWGLKEKKVRTIINGIQLNEISSGRRNQAELKKILVVGRLNKQKGHKYFIEAVGMLEQKKFVVLFLGDGKLREELSDQVKAHGLDHKILFMGFRSGIDEYLNSADLFVLPSLEEGTPMALLEAMAKKIPIIATAVGEVPNIIENGKNGILVQPKNSKEIANAIDYMLTNEYEAIKMSEKGFKTVREKFSCERMVREYESTYENLLK